MRARVRIAVPKCALLVAHNLLHASHPRFTTTAAAAYDAFLNDRVGAGTRPARVPLAALRFHSAGFQRSRAQPGRTQRVCSRLFCSSKLTTPSFHPATSYTRLLALRVPRPLRQRRLRLRDRVPRRQCAHGALAAAARDARRVRRRARATPLARAPARRPHAPVRADRRAAVRLPGRPAYVSPSLPSSPHSAL
ncbi:hypothetical protein FA95DRAFT_1563331, partial [Auriscalpium vulgare]